MDNKDLSISTITVLGSAQIERMPDTAFITLSVNTFDIELNKAQRQNAENSLNLIEKLLGLKIKKSDITTGGYTLYPQYDYKDNNKILKGYSVTNSMRVKITDFSLIGGVIDTAGISGANRMDGVEFALKNDAETYNAALGQALRNARKKAELLAENENCTVLSVLEIKESEQISGGAVPVMARALAFDSGAPATPVNAGKITVKAAVEAVYSIKHR